MPSIGYFNLFMCCFLLFVIFLPYSHSPEKWNFPALKRYQTPQASDWLHCEEEIGTHYSIYYGTSKLVIFFFFSKVAYFGKKNAILKKIHKIYFWFFFHEYIRNYTYICTICKDNFKFTLSLKLKGLMPFIAVPPNACLFSITHFLYGWQKILTNKNISSKHVLHVLFISFFSKMYNKNFYLFSDLRLCP